jgi:hypothetical protein
MQQNRFVTYDEFDDSIYEKKINIGSQLFVIICDNLYVKKRINDIKIGQVIKIGSMNYAYDMKVDEIVSHCNHVYYITGTTTTTSFPSLDMAVYKVSVCCIPADAMILCAMKPENILDELRLWKTKYDELLIAFSSAVGRNNVRKMI